MTLDTPSEYLTRPLRTEEEARKDRQALVRQFNAMEVVSADAFLTADVYQILVTPRNGESYAIEMPWPAMISRRQTLDCLMDQVWADCSARVIFRPANAAPADVSEDFARDYARTMFEGGSDVEAVMGIKFIGRHLTNDQIEEICGS